MFFDILQDGLGGVVSPRKIPREVAGRGRACHFMPLNVTCCHIMPHFLEFFFRPLILGKLVLLRIRQGKWAVTSLTNAKAQARRREGGARVLNFYKSVRVWGEKFDWQNAIVGGCEGDETSSSVLRF